MFLFSFSCLGLAIFFVALHFLFFDKKMLKLFILQMVANC
jgi:hypothetical protein